LQTSKKYLQAATLMLDVQFGQVSDFGKVRTNNEDAMGSFIPTSRRQARSHGYPRPRSSKLSSKNFPKLLPPQCLQL
jgi:hypothetical protein